MYDSKAIIDIIAAFNRLNGTMLITISPLKSVILGFITLAALSLFYTAAIRNCT